MKAAWKFVSMENGAMSAGIDGVCWMPWFYVESYTCQQLVSSIT